MKIKIPNLHFGFPKKTSPDTNWGSIFTAALILILLIEVYIIYLKLYKNLFTEADFVEQSNIVRVDLKSYDDLINFLDDQENFTPQPFRATRANPFK